MENQSPLYLNKRYQLIAPIGRGGMGVVFRARDRLTNHSIALKRVFFADQDADSQASGSEVRLALAHEFRTLASLRHPHIISVLDYGFDAEQPYFTMELLDAPQPLSEAAAGLAPREQARLLAQVLRALIYLHRRGIIHRDIKPSNVLFASGQVKVVDFGIATPLKGTSQLAGTLEYMAPELLLGGAPSETTDLYALGVLAYEMLAGRYPYSRTSMTRMVRGILGTESDLTFSGPLVELFAAQALAMRAGGEEEKEEEEEEEKEEEEEEEEECDAPNLQWPANVDASIVKVVNKLLARRPEDRYQDAAAVLAELSRAIGESLPAETAATRESFLQAAELVGRDAEYAQLTAALTQACTGSGSGFLIAGESGVGKSRLLEELRTLALVRGAIVLRGQAVNAGGGPYRVFYDVLRALALYVEPNELEASVLGSLIPDLGTLLGREIMAAPVLEAQATQWRFLSVIEALITRIQQPTLIILEDIQWAREESLSLLQRILSCVGQLPVLVLASYREDEAPSLKGQIPEMHHLRLSRLPSSDIAHLCTSILGERANQPEIVSLLEKETEGNPSTTHFFPSLRVL